MENDAMTLDVTKLAREVLTNADPAVRRQAAEQLSESHSYTAIAALANALRDENKGVRDAAQRSLLAIGNEHVARSVVDYLLDTNITTRNLASDILIKLGTCSINAVLPFLYDSDHDVRKFAVDILGFIGDSSPGEQLLPLLNDPDANVVVSVVEAFGNMRFQRATKELIRIYAQRDDCKAAVVEALGKIGGDDASDFLLQKYCEQLLLPQKDPLLLYTLLEALAAVGNKKALTILRQQMGTLEGRLQALHFHALYKISERCQNCEIPWNQYTEHLIDALRIDEPEVQKSIVKALATIPGLESTRALLLALGNNEDVDGIILDILLVRDRFLTAVVQTMEEGEFALSKSLLIALQRYIRGLKYRELSVEFLEEEAKFLPKLSALLGQQWHSASEEMRPLLIELLFLIDGDHAIEFLTDITEYPDPWLKMQVIELLAPVSDRRAADFLLRFREDEDEMVRQLACSILELKGYSGEILQTPKAEV